MLREIANRSARRWALMTCAIVTVLCAATSQAQVLGPATVNDFVALHDTPGAGSCDWTRLTYSGGRPLFAIPSSTALVITSIQWIHTQETAGIRGQLELIRGTGPESDPIDYTDRTFELLATVDGGPADAHGRVSGQATFPTGIIVSPRPNARLCWIVSGALSTAVRVTIQGYLVPTVRRVP